MIDFSQRNLTKAEQDNLWVKFKKGDQQAKDKLINSHLRLVDSIVSSALSKSPTNKGREDLFQNGCIGLMEALDAYDIERGTKFTTIAYYYIFKRVWEANSEDDRVIKLPQKIIIATTKLINAESEFSKANGREATTKELIKLTGFSKEKINTLKKNIYLPQTMNEEDQINNYVNNLEDKNSNIEDVVVQNLITEDLHFYLETLSERDRSILACRFGLYDADIMSVANIAKHHNLTPNRVNQIIKKTLKKLKNNLKLLGYNK